MNIQTTDIVDSAHLGSDFGSRLLLADQIIDTFTPLFSEEIDRKKKQLNDNNSDIKKLKSEITTYKKQLQIIIETVKKENLKNEILNEVTYLFNFGVLYGQNKQTVKGILGTIDDQTVEQLSGNVKILTRLVKNNVEKIK